MAIGDSVEMDGAVDIGVAMANSVVSIAME